MDGSSHSAQLDSPYLLSAYNTFKASCSQLVEAEARNKFWVRKLEKSKAQSANTKKHNKKCRVAQELAETDRSIKKWNQARREHLLELQHLENMRSRVEHKRHMELIRDRRSSRSNMRYQSIKSDSLQNESKSSGFKEH